MRLQAKLKIGDIETVTPPIPVQQEFGEKFVTIPIDRMPRCGYYSVTETLQPAIPVNPTTPPSILALLFFSD
jgi:hypothetical protein